MQTVSNLYEQIFQSNNFHVETRVVVGDGNIESGYDESALVSVDTKRNLFSGNYPEVGCCTCGEIYLKMHMPSVSIPKMAKITPYVRLVSNVNSNVSEWIKKGEYYIDTRETTHNSDDLDILSIHGYDAMMKANIPYGSIYQEIEFTLTDWVKNGNTYSTTYVNEAIISTKSIFVEYIGEDSAAFGESVTATQIINGITFSTNTTPPANTFCKVTLRDNNTLAFPATDISVVNDIASKIGVLLEDRANKSVTGFINKGYTVEFPSEYTMRETLGYVAAMYAGCFIINDLGKLQFIPLYDLQRETCLLIDEDDNVITFGSDNTAVLL